MVALAVLTGVEVGAAARMREEARRMAAVAA